MGSIVDAASSAEGGCDGWMAWSARLDGGFLRVGAYDCAGTVAALPAVVLDLVTLPADASAAAISHGRLASKQDTAFERALEQAGW